MMSPVEYAIKKMRALAEKYSRDHECPKCGNEKRKVVLLFEYGDSFFPSRALIYCKECNRQEVFAEMPIESANREASRMIEEKKKKTGPIIIGEK